MKSFTVWPQHHCSSVAVICRSDISGLLYRWSILSLTEVAPACNTWFQQSFSKMVSGSYGTYMVHSTTILIPASQAFYTPPWQSQASCPEFRAEFSPFQRENIRPVGQNNNNNESEALKKKMLKGLCCIRNESNFSLFFQIFCNLPYFFFVFCFQIFQIFGNFWKLLELFFPDRQVLFLSLELQKLIV